VATVVPTVSHASRAKKSLLHSFCGVELAGLIKEYRPLGYTDRRSTFEFRTLEHEGGLLMMRRRNSTPDATRPRDSVINNLPK